MMLRQIVPTRALLRHEARVNPERPTSIIVRLINDDIEYGLTENGAIWRRVVRSRERRSVPLPLAKLQVVPVYDFRWVPVNWSYPLTVPYSRRDFWAPLESHGGAVCLLADGRVLEVSEEEAGGGLLAPEAPLVVI